MGDGAARGGHAFGGGSGGACQLGEVGFAGAAGMKIVIVENFGGRGSGLLALFFCLPRLTRGFGERLWRLILSAERERAEETGDKENQNGPVHKSLQSASPTRGARKASTTMEHGSFA